MHTINFELHKMYYIYLTKHTYVLCKRERERQRQRVKEIKLKRETERVKERGLEKMYVRRALKIHKVNKLKDL